MSLLRKLRHLWFCVHSFCVGSRFVNRAGSLFCKVVTAWYCGRSYLTVGSVFRLATVHLFVHLVQTGSRQSWPRICTRMLSASRRIATRRLDSLLASAEATYRGISLRRQRRSRSETCITKFAPIRQARSHRTSRLSSRSFHGVRLQNKGVVVCTAGFRVHP